MNIDIFLRELEERGSKYHSIAMKLQGVIQQGRDPYADERWRENMRKYYRAFFVELLQFHADFEAWWDSYGLDKEQRES